MSTVQQFKADELELRMNGIAEPVFDMINTGLNDFYINGYESDSFLLMLYDDNRMPFSQRIKRDAFISFVKEALKRFAVTGTFDAYLFILRSIFGAESDINFEVPSPGKLSIDVNAISNTEYEFIGREFNDGIYDSFNLVDNELNTLIFRGLSGIETEYDLALLFSEIMPAGITPSIFLSFFIRSNFIAEDSLGINHDMIDHLGNQLIFSEIGG